MQSTESQIRSFESFAGALILASVQSSQRTSVIASIMGHPIYVHVNEGEVCCRLHRAAELSGGEEAKWLAEYAYDTKRRHSKPDIGVDPRVDCWELFGSRQERLERLAASADSGNVFAIDLAFKEVYIGPPQLDEAKKKWLRAFQTMPLDQLESVAERGSMLATRILRQRLHSLRLVDDARYTFWDFVFCVVYNQEFQTDWSQPELMSQNARFQLGKCLWDTQRTPWFFMSNVSACMYHGQEVLFLRVQAEINTHIEEYKLAEAKARKAIDTWALCAQNQGLICDVRLVIVEMLWSQRWTWINQSGEPIHGSPKKRLKVLYEDDRINS